jgi:predicted TIM-barrel fold metal-dependent hydrolase
MLIRTSDKTSNDDDGGLPIPTQIVSNGEYWPIPQTPKQRRIQTLIETMADERAKKLGLSRRQFLRTAAGTATALMAINIVNGCGDGNGSSGGFAVDDCATRDPAAARETFKSDFFVMDVQTHHVDLDGEAGMNPLLREFFSAFRFCSPETIEADTCHPGVIEELSRANFLKEMFLDSETAVAIMSGIPAPSRGLQALSNEAMASTRDIANELGASQRMLTQGMLTPNFPPGNDAGTNIEDMEFLVKELGIKALKTYTGAGAGPNYPSNALNPWGTIPPWWLDDEETSYKMLAEAARLGINIINTHKGLRLGIFDPEYIHPRDIPRVALDWPNMNFVIYHSAGEYLMDLVALKKNRIPNNTNVYSELGSIFAQAVAGGGPESAADRIGELLGELILAFGSDHIIWGTDSIWWGTAQWQIDALKTFRMPEHLIEERGYPEITDEIKAQIFGLNAARLYNINVEEVRCTIPPDFSLATPTPKDTGTSTPTPTSTPPSTPTRTNTPLGVPTGTAATPTVGPTGVPTGTAAARSDMVVQAKKAYAEIAQPSLRTYGPKTRREFIKLNFNGRMPIG